MNEQSGGLGTVNEIYFCPPGFESPCGLPDIRCQDLTRIPLLLSPGSLLFTIWPDMDFNFIFCGGLQPF
jgi:hypothetical protein